MKKELPAEVVELRKCMEERKKGFEAGLEIAKYEEARLEAVIAELEQMLLRIENMENPK